MSYYAINTIFEQDGVPKPAVALSTDMAWLGYLVE